jgi:hypothetical protein
VVGTTALGSAKVLRNHSPDGAGQDSAGSANPA